MKTVETFRSVVSPNECDHLGHMNVSRYFAAVSDGMFTFQTLMGLGPTDVREGRQLSFAVVHAESDFKAELRSGDVICLKTSLKRIGGKSAVFRHVLLRVEDDTEVFETEFQCVLLDLKTRRAAEIPGDLRERMEPYMEAAQDTP